MMPETISKNCPNCPKCQEEDIDYLDTCDEDDEEAEEHLECLNCGCVFSVKIVKTRVYLYDTIKIQEDGKR